MRIDTYILGIPVTVGEPLQSQQYCPSKWSFQQFLETQSTQQHLLLLYLSHCNVLEQMYLKPILLGINVILAAEITADRFMFLPPTRF